MRKSDKPKTTRNGAGNVGLLPARDVRSMLDAFGRMSLHDQAAIFCVIHARAKDNQRKNGGAQ